MKPLTRIFFTLTIIVFVTGLIAFARQSNISGRIETYFILWIVASVILAGLSIWSALRKK
jgi:hypothetical protein